MRKGWLQRSHSAIFIVAFGSDQIRVSLQRRSVESGIWYFPLSLWVCALTGSFVVIEISHVGCCLSLKVSQPEREEHRPKLHLEERLVGEGVEEANPWAVITAKQEIIASFQGELYHSPHHTCTPPCASEAHLKGSPLSLPFPWEFSTANRTPELCWATASNFQACSPADYSDMMSFFIEARLDFFLSFQKCGSHDL